MPRVDPREDGIRLLCEKGSDTKRMPGKEFVYDGDKTTTGMGPTTYTTRRRHRYYQFPPARCQSEELYSIGEFTKRVKRFFSKSSNAQEEADRSMQKLIEPPQDTEQVGVAEEAVGVLHRPLGTITTTSNITQPTTTIKALTKRSNQLHGDQKLSRRKLAKVQNQRSYAAERLTSKSSASAEDAEVSREAQV